MKRLVKILQLAAFGAFILFSCTKQRKEVMAPESKIPLAGFGKTSTANSWATLQSAYNDTADTIKITSDIDFGTNSLSITRALVLIGDGSMYRLHSDNASTTLLTINTSASVKIENLEFDGESSKERGILVTSGEGTVIIDCELHHFKNAAVHFAYSGTSGTVKGSFIHYNTGGWGYGVLVSEGAFATVDDDSFRHNFHDIAGTGEIGTGFHAKNNTTDDYLSHAFDMHGGCSSQYRAGHLIIIENNIFNSDSVAAIKIRGVPNDKCEIKNNTFAHNWIGNAFEQEIESVCTPSLSDDHDGFGNIRISSNNFTSEPNIATFQVNYGTQWNRLIRTSDSIDSIAFGDFNNDNIADLFRQNDGNFEISWSALRSDTTTWRWLNESDIPIKDLAFGDFDDDGYTDVFSSWDSSGTGYWWVAWGGEGSWDIINQSAYKVKDLYFDDVDGDGTDVIRWDAGEEKWYYSQEGTTSWTLLTSWPDSAGVGADPRNLHRTMSDFNGDGVHESDSDFKISLLN